jgi:hypothetical protein
MALTTIISGGQTGADQGGLAAGVALGLRTGGWIPKGWKTLGGPRPDLGQLPSGGLKEHASRQYPPRTEANVAASGGTLLFGVATSGGSDLTIRTVLLGPNAKKGAIPKEKLAKMRGAIPTKSGRPALFVAPWKAGKPIPKDLFPSFVAWLSDNNITILNVAGNRESGQPGIFDATREFILQALRGSPTTSRKPAPAKRLYLRFNQLWRYAILSGQKHEEFRDRKLLHSGQLGVTKVAGVREFKEKDVFLRLKGEREEGGYVYALSLDGTFRDIPRNSDGVPLSLDAKWVEFDSRPTSRSTPAKAKTTTKKAATTKKKAATKKASTRTPRTPRPPRHRQAQKAPDADHIALIGATFPWSKITRFDREKDMEVPAPVTGKLIVYPINPRAALYARDALSARDPEELAAIKGVEFGVLSEFVNTAIDQQVKVFEAEKDRTPSDEEYLAISEFAKKDVITFGNNVAAQPASWPLPSKIVDRDANIISVLVASGNLNDLTAESVFPLGSNGWFENRSIASILLNAIMFGLWDKGEWKGEVFFVLPQAQMRGSKKKEYDATGAARLIKYLCGQSNDSCPSESFLRDMEKALVWLERNLPRKLYTYLGIKNDRDKKALLMQLAASLPEMPIGYQGEKGKPRTIKPADYYGSGPTDRSLATERKKIREYYTLGDESIGLRDRLHREGAMVAAEFDSFADIAERQKSAAQIAFLDMVRSKMRAGQDLEDKELLKMEQEAFKRGASLVKMEQYTSKTTKAKRKTKKAKVGLPLHSKGPLLSLMFTMYWEDPSGDGIYQIVNHSKSYPIAEIELKVARIMADPPPHTPKDGEEDIPVVLSEAAALRCVALNEMHIPELNRELAEHKNLLEPKLLVIATADARTAASWIKLGLPKPVSVSKEIAAYFGEIDLKTGRGNRLLVSEFTSPWVKEDKETKLIPRKIPQSAQAVIITSLLGVEVVSTGALRKKRSALFSLRNVQRSDSYAYWEKAIAEKAKTPLEPDELAMKAYRAAIATSISSGKPKGLSDEIVGARRGQKAFGGTKVTRSSRVKGRRQHETSKAMIPRKNIFSFAIKLCKTKGVSCAEGKTTGERFDEQDIADMMVAFSIEGDENSLKALKELKSKLEDKLAGDFYAHTVAGVLAMGSEDEFMSTPVLDALALTNTGRKPRKRRKARSPRGSRRNPLDDRNTGYLVDYATGRGTKEARAESKAILERAFSDLGPAKSWDINDKNVDAFFPRGPADIGQWKPSVRLSQAKEYDLISRLGDSRLTQEEKAVILSELEEAKMPFLGEKSALAVEKGAELSLREAMGILTKQQEKRKKRVTMQASSGLCMSDRTRKLSHYTLPGLDDPNQAAGLWRDRGNTGMNPNRDVIIWVSPKGAAPRVMTFRRGSHLDCDFTSDDISDLPDLLGKAIQSSMYWLTERQDRNRQRNTSFWVGRAGERGVYLAYNAVKDGAKMSVSSILGNLRNPARKAEVLTAREVRDDKRYYEKSVARLFGSVTPGSFSPPPQKKVEIELVVPTVPEDLLDEM